MAILMAGSASSLVLKAGEMAPRDPRLPRVQERYALQQLLSGEWKAATDLYPSGSKTLASMVAKGWLEERKTTRPEYKITYSGRQAFAEVMPE